MASSRIVVVVGVVVVVVVVVGNAIAVVVAVVVFGMESQLAGGRAAAQSCWVCESFAWLTC